VDNFSGGMTAGQILARLSPKRPVIVAGPLTDVRSALRTKGFRHIFPKARVIELESWFVESAHDKILPQLRRWSIDGLFCCSDRLALATIISYAHLQRPTPPLISFDNTPLAEKLRISAIGIPWERLCKEATVIIKLRLAGHRLFSFGHRGQDPCNNDCHEDDPSQKEDADPIFFPEAEPTFSLEPRVETMT